MKILITTGSWNAALVVMKSLVKRGCQSYLLDFDPYCAGFRSRYCSGGIVTPRESDKAGYVDALIKIISTQKFDLLIPISDHAMEFLSEGRQRIEPWTRMFLPSKDLVSLARFKDRAYRFMLEHDIPIPKTHFPQSIADVERLVDTVSYPCVVKKPRGSANKGNMYFESKKGLVDYYRGLNPQDLWPVIQEFVEGDFYSLTALAWDGEIADCFMYTARQEYALHGTPPCGMSVINEDLFGKAANLIRLLKWSGMINLDSIKDKNGEFKFLEINPRFPGSSDFAYALGVDFPSAYLDFAFGKTDVHFKGFSYKPWVKFHFVFAEIAYTLKNKKNFLSLLANFLNPFLKTDLPWGDLKLFIWKLKHAWWFWRDKKHLPEKF